MMLKPPWFATAVVLRAGRKEYALINKELAQRMLAELERRVPQ